MYLIFFRYVPTNPVRYKVYVNENIGRSNPGGSSRPRQDHLFLAWLTFLPPSLLYFCSAVVHKLPSPISLRTCPLHPVHRNSRAAVPQVIPYLILETYRIGRPRERDSDAVSLKKASLGSRLSGSRRSCPNRLSRMVVRIVCVLSSLRLTPRMHL